MTQPESLISGDLDPYSGATGAEIWAFFLACNNGDLSQVQSLTAANPKLVHASIHYYLPLHFAVRENHVEIVRHLLNLGANPMCGRIGSPQALGGAREILQLFESRIAENYSVSGAGEPLAILIHDRNRNSSTPEANPVASPSTGP